jgi:hypothetical protein
VLEPNLRNDGSAGTHQTFPVFREGDFEGERVPKYSGSEKKGSSVDRIEKIEFVGME